MTQTELYRIIAEEAGITIYQAKAALECAFEEIRQAVAKGDRVTLINFGNFERIRYKERRHNALNGGTNIVSARFAPKFRASQQFKHLCLNAKD